MEFRSRDFLFVLAMALLIAVLGTCNYRRSASPPLAVEEPDIWVHVSGCVQNPGVYRLTAGSRIHEAVELAGGALECGDLQRLNLAARIQDGQKIHVPRALDEARSPQEGGLININYADQRTLETLPGIGPEIAKRIIEYREKVGGFASIEEIMNVERIGPITFEKIKELITVD